jgi:hypothetical protein
MQPDRPPRRGTLHERPRYRAAASDEELTTCLRELTAMGRDEPFHQVVVAAVREFFFENDQLTLVRVACERCARVWDGLSSLAATKQHVSFCETVLPMLLAATRKQIGDE